MSDEECLRRLAREAVAAGRIPAAKPKGTWGGDGTGAPCAICGLPIPEVEIGFEVEFSQDVDRGSGCCHLHSRCFAAWEFERHTLESGEHENGASARTPVSGCGHGTHSHPATDTRCLSAENKAGSMPDRERNSKREGGSA